MVDPVTGYATGMANADVFEELPPLYSPEQARALDRWAIEQGGIASLDLMETAGGAVARAVTDLDPYAPVRVVCGKGNNGGDGFVCARQLCDGHRDVVTLLLASASELAGDAKAHYQRLLECGGQVTEISEADGIARGLDSEAIVVDAMLGTGAKGAPKGLVAAVISELQNCNRPVVSVDMPSGIDAASGELLGDKAVSATVTTTFHADKIGLWINPGRCAAGRVEVSDIGIPSTAQRAANVVTDAHLSSAELLDLYPRREGTANKFSSGSVVVVGGCRGLTGAPCLTSMAAMRTGAGYVQAVVPESLNTIFEEKLLEVMTVPVTDIDGFHAGVGESAIVDACKRANSIVVGPGCGRASETTALVRSLVRKIDRPIVVDADGLNALVDEPEQLQKREQDTVLTPHSGELARLLAVSSQEVESARLKSARSVAESSGATVVLKGQDTLVVSPTGQLVVNAETTSALATAGSGDVLSGVIAALMARGLPGFEAAALGVYLHSQAALKATDSISKEALIASDLIDSLPQVLP